MRSISRDGPQSSSFHVFIIFIIFVLCSHSIQGETWFATVNSWEVDRQSQTVGLDMSSSITGRISAVNVTPSGMQIAGYHSGYTQMRLNDVAHEESTSAREGEIVVQEGLYLRSAAIVDVARNITKSYGDPRFFFEFNEIWPAIISTSRTISYHGSNINDREIAGNNLDLIRASNFMCTDLNKSSSAYLELERMNATVVAIGSSIGSVDFLPTKTTIFAIREEANGTTDLEFRLIDPDMKTISNEMSERLQGAFAVNVTAHTGLKHLKFQDEECHSLECCDSQ